MMNAVIVAASRPALLARQGEGDGLNQNTHQDDQSVHVLLPRLEHLVVFDFGISIVCGKEFRWWQLVFYSVGS